MGQKVKVKCGIYKITSPSYKIYIGQSIDIERRFSDYKIKKAKQQPRLRNSFLKHKIENHKFEIIEECKFEQLNIRERYWQDYYDVLGNKGLNCLLTNTEIKPVISENFGNLVCEGIKNYNLNKIDFIYQFDLKGNLIKTWQNRTLLNLNYPNIRRPYLNLHISKNDLFLDNSILSSKPIISLDCVKKANETFQKRKKSKINQYDLEGNFIKQWKNKQQIYETLRIHISSCLSNKVSNCHGFIWRYNTDNFIKSNNLNTPVRRKIDRSNYKIFIYNKTGNLIDEIYSNDFKKSKSICRVLSGERNFYKGLIYSKKTLTKDEIVNKFTKTCLKIYQYNLDGSFIREWESGMELKRTTGIQTAGSFNENGELIKKGFLWKREK